MYKIHLCGPHLSVPGATECCEALWSNMRACKRCEHPSCYRVGMTARQASADNTAGVKAKRGDVRIGKRIAKLMETDKGRAQLGMPPRERMNDGK